MGKSEKASGKQETVHARSVYANAVTYMTAASHLSGLTNMPALAGPSTVIGVFSIELLLKALYLLRTGKLLRGHKINELFGKLHESDQAMIRACFDDLIRQSPYYHVVQERFNQSVELPIILERLNDLFVNLRYLYEGGWAKSLASDGSAGAFGLPELALSIQEVILDSKPDWRKIAEGMSFR